MLLAEHRFDEAKTAFAKAVELNPQNTSARRGLALIARIHEDFETSLNHLTAAHNSDPGDRTVMVDLGWLYAELNQLQKAQEYFNAVLKLDPGHPAAIRGRSQVLRKMQQASP